MNHVSSRTARRDHALLLIGVFAANLAFSALSSAQAAPVTAKKADDFVDSIGVCLHVQNYNDAQWQTIKSQLGTLGVRYYRDGLEHVDNATYKARFQDLFNTYGLKMLAVCGPYGNNNLQPNGSGSLAGVVNKVADIKPFLQAVEGPNEPEYFWYDGWNYGGFTDRPSQVVWYQNKLYDSIKADSRTSSVPVASFATARPETYQNYFSNKPLIKHDIFAWHYYNGRYQPTPYDWASKGREFLRSDIATKPGYITEHGFRIRGDGNVTQKAQMKLNTRSVAFFFNTSDVPNTQKVFFYVAGPDSAAGEDYGLDNSDYTPRPAYNSLKSLISTLKEASWKAGTKTWRAPNFSPGSLDYTITGNAGEYGFRLVQKSNGEFYLMALPYIQVSNAGDGSDIANTPRNVTITFTSNKKVSQIKADETTGLYSETSLTASADSVNVALGDSLTLFKISAPGGPTAPIGKR